MGGVGYCCGLCGLVVVVSYVVMAGLCLFACCSCLWFLLVEYCMIVGGSCWVDSMFAVVDIFVSTLVCFLC